MIVTYIFLVCLYFVPVSCLVYVLVSIIRDDLK